MHSHKKEVKLKSISKLGIVGLFSSLGFAAVVTIWSVYLESFLHNPAYVGFLTSFFSIVSLGSYFFLIPIIEKHNKIKLYSLALIMYIISYFAFFVLSNIYLVVILGTLLAIMVSMRVTCFGILVRNKSKNDKVSKNEGVIYTASNIAWLFGPLIAGFIANRYGLNKVFLFAVIILIFSFSLFHFFKVKDNHKVKKIDKNILRVAKDFFSGKERRLAYVLGGGVNFWWALIYIYMPIYIIEHGLGDIVLGVFLAAIVVPLILFEYYFSRIAGRIGFKKIFFMGYFILGVCAVLCFVFNTPYVILGLLVLASVGASMIEPTTEAYFFDIVSVKQRDRFYGPYNTAIEVGAFKATAVAAVILLFLPFEYIFLFFALGTFTLALMSLRVKNIIECKR